MTKDKSLRERDRKFIKEKAKQIEEAKRNGNDPRAERLSVELLQYLGIGGETPILPLLQNNE